MYPPRFFLLFLLICIPAALRVIEHPWNMAPVGALALFAGAHFRQKSWAFIVPICVMFISDVAMGWSRGNWNYTFHTLMPLIYACYAVSVCLGLGIRSWWKASEKRHAGQKQSSSSRLLSRVVPVPIAMFLGAVFFFVVTNFGVWMFFPTYPHTAEGLMECYVAAIPYFKRTLLSDAIYTTILFGGFALLKVRLPVLEETKLLHAD